MPQKVEAGAAAAAAFLHEIHVLSLFFVSLFRKIKKGVHMKRSQNARKMKAIARAVSKNEKSEEKIQKAKSKKTRIQSAKSLYD
ncbi:unnamed protein product [Miscanthus lutarioriparius]|uniref:Uncharacterized protein n=1 Tax=Miscanthus lutarioriparius TaxID=422564 RepID=A0A811NF04_9POAL|nr:unnamed protein product [Miscanthus lutarioriparius]